MDILKTATGKEFPVASVAEIRQPDQVHIRICQTPMATVAAVFSDPKETQQLWFNGQYMASYTMLVVLVPEGNCIRVVLGKE